MTLEEFQQADLRAGIIRTARRVEGSEKLLCLEVDLGEDVLRQILSGIGKAYAPEALVGKNVVIIANLAPRMMMGMESRGMLLAATGTAGTPLVLTIDGEVAAGTKIT